MQCSHCGTYVPPGSENCPNCAAPLGTAQDVQLHMNGFPASLPQPGPVGSHTPQAPAAAPVLPQGAAPFGPPSSPVAAARKAPLVLGILGIFFFTRIVLVCAMCIPGLVMTVSDRKNGRNPAKAALVLNIVALSLAFMWRLLIISL